MATVLDLGLVGIFKPVFTFLFIFALMYAVMDRFKIMGESKVVKVTIAFSIAILFLFSTNVLKLVNLITPWFVFLVVAVLFTISLFIFMGVKESSMISTVGRPDVYWPILIAIIIFLFVAITQVFSETFETKEDGVGTTESGIAAIVHPRVLGAIFLLVIAGLAIKAISSGLTGAT